MIKDEGTEMISAEGRSERRKVRGVAGDTCLRRLPEEQERQSEKGGEARRVD